MRRGPAPNPSMRIGSGFREARQTAEVIDELDVLPANSIEVKVAITKATGRLPTDTQSEKILRLLGMQQDEH